MEFMHDGASIHQSAETKAWLQGKRVKMLANGRWPALSPDLNPIEHVWPMVNRNLESHIFNSKDELYEALNKAFEKIPKEDVVNLHNSISRRIAAVIVAQGAHTKY